MEHKKLKIVNVFLVLGILFFIVAGIFSFVRPDYIRNNLFEIILLLQIVLGSVIITSATLVTKYAYQLFLGLVIFFFGLLTFLISSVLPFTIYQCWPIFGIISSICLFASGYFSYRKMRLVYVFPTIAVFCFSVWYSLFSFKIIKMSFTKAVLIALPVFLITVAVFLVLYFFAQQKYSKLIINEDELMDESVF